MMNTQTQQKIELIAQRISRDPTVALYFEFSEEDIRSYVVDMELESNQSLYN